MKKRLFTRQQAIWCFALTAATIYPLLWHLSRSMATLPQANLVGMAASCDLLVTVPLLYYCLLVRPGHSSVAALAAIVLAGARTAGVLFPGDAQGWHAAIRWIGLPLELGMIVAVVRRLRRVDHSLDVAARLRAGSGAVVRNRWMAELLAAELEVFYFALFSWRAKPQVPSGWRAFSAGDASGFSMLSVVMAAGLVFEGVAMHLLLLRWSHTAAWVATGFDVYALIWVLALARSLRLQPILVGESELVLRLGLLWRVEISRENILACRRVGHTFEAPQQAGYLSLVKINQPQWVLELREPVWVKGPYGLRRWVSSIGVAVDDAAGFESSVFNNEGLTRDRSVDTM